MKTIEVWRVEEWDGGERHNFSCYMLQSAVSKAEIEAKIPHCLVRPEVLTVFESFDERDSNTALKLRQSAWDKLSPQERKVMGMTERPI